MRHLRPNEMYCCSRGCGECEPVETMRWYSRTEFPDGSLLESAEPVVVSSCCGAAVQIWDEQAQEIVEDFV